MPKAAMTVAAQWASHEASGGAAPPVQVLTVAAKWASLESMEMGHLPWLFREYYRQAFYGGAAAMLELLHDTAEPQLVKALQAELRAYMMTRK